MDKTLARIIELSDKIRTLMFIKTILNTDIDEDLYDELRRELENLEAQHPEFISANSPTMQIGYNFNINRVDDKITRNYPMLSLKNTYEVEDAIKWINKFKDHKIYCEPKYDGVAVSIEYKNGFFLRASTRGDGYVGENVTEYVRRIVPVVIKDKRAIDLRCEIYSESGRSIVSGDIRKKSVTNLNSTDIKVSAYTILVDNEIQTQEYMYEWVINHDYLPSKYIEYSNQHVLDIQNDLLQQASVSDGIVLKLNKSINDIGNRYMPDAIAFKVSPTGVETEIIGIEWEMSRLGRLIPIVRIKEVMIGEAKINRIAGHNMKHMRERKLGIGSVVVCKRVGGVVPQIVNVKEPVEHNDLVECPYCKSTLNEDVCINEGCWRRNRERMMYFWSKLDVQDIGHKFVERNFKECNTILSSIDYMESGHWIKRDIDRKIYTKWNNREIDTKKAWIAMGIPGLSDQYFSNLNIDKIITGEDVKNNKDRILYDYYVKHKDEVDSILKKVVSIV